MTRLLTHTPSAWIDAVMSDFNTFLQDHANCERKASATAMSLLVHYSDKDALTEAMLELAQEELDHFKQVFALMRERGVPLARDEKDPYIAALFKHARTGHTTYYLLDRLLIAGLVEARGCERFGLLAEALQDPALKTFYMDITRSEARHGGLFIRLARVYYTEEEVSARLETLAQIEADIIAQLPVRVAVH
jgi:tRNA-(ms[2]io[6]A)-hydroxylase